MNNFDVMSAGFDNSEELDDVIGTYTGMRCCIGYVGNEPQFIDPKELSKDNIDAACEYLNLNPAGLSYGHIAQAVMKWINAGRPCKSVINNEEISLSDFF